MPRYGGTERVLLWLARGLAEAGVRVTLLAPAGSATPWATVVPITLPAGREATFDPRPWLPGGVDLVHAHFPLGPQPDLPLRWTLHGNLRPDRSPLPGAIAISRDHAARHGIADWVHNGLDPSEYQFSAAPGRYDLFLGRLHRVKGWHWAVAGTRRCGRSLIVAGGWRPSLRPGLRFRRAVGGDTKARLLAEAACVWTPAQWEEPFGLAAIEAMVSGTPVLGTRRGALPEVILPPGGLLGDTLDDLVAQRAALDAVDREAVRQVVLDRFTYRQMTAEYLRVYRETLSAPAPVAAAGS